MINNFDEVKTEESLILTSTSCDLGQLSLHQQYVEYYFPLELESIWKWSSLSSEFSFPAVVLTIVGNIDTKIIQITNKGSK